jgi:hypothetical protein
MTVSGLRKLYERNNPGGHFFDRGTMRFFGDTMANFGVRDGGKVDTYSGESVDAWQLYRKRPVNGGLVGPCSYFSKTDGSIVAAME